MFNFLLDATQNPGMGLGGFALTLVAFGLVFYFLFLRPQKKRDQEATDMRNSLAVGDEVTTLGGIIGKVISIKEETFVLETTKDKTKIRFHKGAVRSIDVKIADVVAAQQTETETPAEEAPAEEK